MLNSREVDQKFKKLKSAKNRASQHDYADDPKRTVGRLSASFSPMWAIPPAEDEQFLARR
jgi:hypothetical protein